MGKWLDLELMPGDFRVVMDVVAGGWIDEHERRVRVVSRAITGVWWDYWRHYSEGDACVAS